MNDALSNEMALTQSDGASHEPARVPVSVCFVPFDTRNPYQAELARHLRGLGVQVATDIQMKGLPSRILRGRDTPNVIHLHWLPPIRTDLVGGLRSLAFLARLLLSRVLGRRIVWTVHNLYAHEGTSRAAERWVAMRVASLTSTLIVHSETAGGLVAEELKIQDRCKLVVIPHGNYIGSYGNRISRENARLRLELDPHGVVALFFGNIRPYKGVLDLIAAFKQLAAADASLVLAGRPLNEATLKSVEAAISSDSAIRLRAGFIPDDAVQDYMNASDVVVFPYQDVLTSGAIILAMSFGRACVAPAIGCIPDVLNERGGFLYDPRERNGLHNALDKAFQNPARLREMGEYNLERAREWGWDRVAAQTAAVYNAALGPARELEAS